MLTYATRYDYDNGGTPLPAEPVQVGDHVLQIAYGKGLGRLDDCGRRGLVVAVNRVTATVHFGDYHGTQRVSPSVLRLEQRAFAPAPV